MTSEEPKMKIDPIVSKALRKIYLTPQQAFMDGLHYQNTKNAMIEVYLETKKQFLDEIKRKEVWHKGECRGFPDCSICLFLRELKEFLKGENK